jgi:hypothetical protein
MSTLIQDHFAFVPNASFVTMGIMVIAEAKRSLRWSCLPRCEYIKAHNCLTKMTFMINQECSLFLLILACMACSCCLEHPLTIMTFESRMHTESRQLDYNESRFDLVQQMIAMGILCHQPLDVKVSESCGKSPSMAENIVMQ